MNSFTHLTDPLLLNAYSEAVEKNLDPYFIQLLLKEILSRGLEVKAKDSPNIENLLQ